MTSTAWCEDCGEDPREPGHFKCVAYCSGEIPCVDEAGHRWVVSDEDENDCYCERCCCGEY